MHITYDYIETFDEAVEHYIQQWGDGMRNEFASMDKETQHKIIQNSYPQVKIKDSDHFSL